MRDVSSILDDIGIGKYHFVQHLVIGAVLFIDGAEILVSSSIMGLLGKIWNLSASTQGLMMTVVFVGLSVGGAIGGRCSDRFGRRVVIFCSYAGLVGCGLSTAGTTGPWSMVFVRFCFGMSVGAGISPCTALVMETTPTQYRGVAFNSWLIFFSLGEIYTSLMLMVFMPDLDDSVDHNSWRLLTLACIVPPAAVLLVPFFMLQESPRWCLAVGRKKEALESLKYIASINGEEDVQEELDDELEQEILGDPEAASSGQLPGEAAALLGEARRQTVRRQTTSMARQQKHWTFIFTHREYRSILFGGWYLCAFSNFMFYGLTYSLAQIFRYVGNTNPAQDLLIVSLCGLPGIGLAGWFLASETIGHRKSLTMMATALAALHVGLLNIDSGGSWQWQWIGMASAPLAKFTASAFFTVVSVYLGEAFPSSVRCTGIAFCFSAGRVGSVIAPICFAVLSTKQHGHTLYFLISLALCLLAIVVIKKTLSFEMKHEPLETGMTATRASVFQKS